MGYKDFDDYLKSCLKQANSDISIDYARRQAKAGAIEKQIFGEDGIGTMKEGALRPLYENVMKKNQKKVYEAARKGLKENEYPTGEQIIKAAQDLKAYKQQKSKLKDTKNKVEPDTSGHSKSKQSLSSIKVFKEITEDYRIDEIENILGFLMVTQQDDLHNKCDRIINNCKEITIKNLIQKLTEYVKENLVSDSDGNTDGIDEDAYFDDLDDFDELLSIKPKFTRKSTFKKSD